MTAGPASQLLEGLGVTDPRAIDLEAIAWMLGVRVRTEYLQSCAARITGCRDRAIITVDANSDWRRRRFSIAHELGHWHYHRGRNAVCRSRDIGSPQTNSAAEREADLYAVDLLMPTFMFIASAGRRSHRTWGVVDSLAREYGTSRMATALRLLELDMWPAMLICRSDGGTAWHRRSSSFPISVHPSRSAIDDFANSTDSIDSQAKPQIIKPEIWFPTHVSREHSLTAQTRDGFGGTLLTLLVSQS